MTDTSTPQEDDQNLWRALYTADGGWSPAVAFADHLSFAAPALAEVDGTLYCVHRGAREEGEGGKVLPVRWTSFTPASVQPYVTALSKAAEPLPKEATEEQTAAWQAKVAAAAEALEQARKWTPDAYVHGAESIETPALVNDGGTLRMVFTTPGGYYGDGEPQLHETVAVVEDGEAGWSRPEPVTPGYGAALAPALAVLDGAVHLVYVDLDADRLVHLVRNAEGEWNHATDAEGKPLETPYVDSERLRNEWQESKEGLRANLSLTAHDGKLHLVQNAFGILLHAVFDGRAWTGTAAELESESGPNHLPGPVPVDKAKEIDAAFSYRTAALASYDGRLHAVYPSARTDAGDALRHCTWTADGGWTRPVVLEGHDSNNTPALLGFKEGPAESAREALLLVHRGIDRYVPPVPPVPPAPPSIKDVVSRGTTVTGKTVSDHGRGAWSRLRHDLALTPATLKDGKKAVIATWDAVAEYYWGWWWYRDGGTRFSTVRVDGGTLWIKKPSDKNFLKYADFGGEAFSNGHLRVDVLITDLEPGTYEISLSSSNSKKTGGYWWDEHLFNGRTDREYWTAFDLSRCTATVTIAP
ncbi:hypothetical protein [Streptomyces sp. NPDC051563]|uniref:hypothetical protein n=1 Tax=Streptomyces sp. NPDC051563 TaxID=3365659 RepID=UPI00378950D4